MPIALAIACPAAAWGTTATTRFTSPGGGHVFIVPPGVHKLTVAAIGAAGGTCGDSEGGRGAAVTAEIPAVPGEPLFVGVGGRGGNCPPGGTGAYVFLAGGTGGVGGGGRGGGSHLNRFAYASAGGGGASVVSKVVSTYDSMRLLVVAGGGGGAAPVQSGGDADVVDPHPKAPEAGIGGFEHSGGVGGEGLTRGRDGSFGAGGDGADADPRCTFQQVGGGGGGGGGYYGGGGGGSCLSDRAQGSGGGGSSFVFPTGRTLLAPKPTNVAAAVSLIYAAPRLELTASSLSFGAQTPGSISATQTETVSNRGSAPLVVSGVELDGADPDDFAIDNRCQRPVAVGSSCHVRVRFAPHKPGARSATMKLSTNAVVSPEEIKLVGGHESQALDPKGATTAGAARQELTDVRVVSATPGALRRFAFAEEDRAGRGDG